MNRPARSRLVLGVLVLALSACAGEPFSSPKPSRAPAPSESSRLGTQSACEARFPDEDGWLGGDAAASVVLPGSDGRRSLWLFGDSFVELAGARGQRRYPFVHNTIAVSHCDADGRWQLDYAWRHGEDGSPRAFFEPTSDPALAAPTYFWPLGAVGIGERVFVALLRVAPAPATGPFQLPFRPAGVDLAQIEGTAGPPESWRIRLSTWSTRADVLPAASLVAEGAHLYAFAFLDRGDGRSPRILTRVPLAALGGEPRSLEDRVETLAEDGRFVPGLDPNHARILMDDDASEMSVHFDPGLGEWLAVYSDPTGSGDDDRGDTIWLRRARRLAGPWSARAPLLRVPELAAGPDAEPGEPFCYAGKAHPELAPSGELVVTWVCNLFAERPDEIPAVLERLRTTPSLYRPRLARLAVPPAVGAGPAAPND